MMKTPISRTVLLLAALSLASACSPAVGSEEWCDAMKKKDKTEWSVQDASDFAKHCILPK